jgi:hypothetical protein
MKHHAIDLIVIGTTVIGAIAHALLGNVAERLVRIAMPGPDRSGSRSRVRSAGCAGGGREGEVMRFLPVTSPPLQYFDPNPPPKVAILETRCVIDDVAILQFFPDLGIQFLLHAMARRAHGTVRNGPHDADSIAEIDGEPVNVRSLSVRVLLDDRRRPWLRRI